MHKAKTNPFAGTQSSTRCSGLRGTAGPEPVPGATGPTDGALGRRGWSWGYAGARREGWTGSGGPGRAPERPGCPGSGPRVRPVLGAGPGAALIRRPGWKDSEAGSPRHSANPIVENGPGRWDLTPGAPPSHDLRGSGRFLQVSPALAAGPGRGRRRGPAVTSNGGTAGRPARGQRGKDGRARAERAPGADYRTPDASPSARAQGPPQGPHAVLASMLRSRA